MIIEVAVLRRFEDLIRARAGLNMREQEAPVLLQTLRTRAQKKHLLQPLAYLDFLATDSPAAHEEWKELFVILTNQESYFFRDGEQLSVIATHILPELMRRNRESRTLRLWSAGCSTGEEPYSLAMMVDEIVELRDWRVTILGSDISAAALERARRGVYGAWSFRALDERKQERFFRARGKEWEVAPRLRQNVVFESNNLFGDGFPRPNSEIHDMDLILCRNVFIYFGRDAVASVVQKFSATLRPGGFLVCGHAELHDVPLADFSARAFPQSVIYQRETRTPIPSPIPSPIPREPIPREPIPRTSTTLQLAPVSRVASAPKPALKPATAASPTVSKAVESAASATQILERAAAQIGAGQSLLALGELESLLAREPVNLAALCLAAQAQANAGRLEAAENSCARALKVSPFAALPYHLQARIAEERGQSESAKSLLKKVIYLSPHSVWATLDLSAVYRREGDDARAAQMQRAALGLLDGLSDAAQVPAEEFAVEEPLTVGELKRQLQADLAIHR